MNTPTLPPKAPPRNPFCTAALDYLARGWQPIPLRPGSKAPACPDWPALRLDEAGAVATWTAEPTPGIGLLCGAPSGLVVLDFDDPAAFAAWRAEHPDLVTRVVTRDGAPEGRGHWYFALDQGQAAPPSTKGAGWDLLSTGRQVCAPPTRHPSGGLYRVANDAPLAAWRDEYTPARPAPAEPTLRTTAGTAGRELAWGDTIGPAAGIDPAPGYARAALDSEAAAVAAATPGNRNDRLNVAALKLGQLVGAGLLTVPEVEGALVEAARAAGLSETEARTTVASGLRKGMTEPRAVVTRATPRAPAAPPTLTTAEPPTEAPEPWTDPAPLDGGAAGVLDRWPWATTPEPLRAMGQAIAEARNTPDAMAGAVVLGAAGAALGNRLALTIKEGHVIRGNLYWLVAAGVGVGKTPALRPALAPLVDWEAAQRAPWLDALRHWRARADLAEARRGAVKRDAAKAGADLDRLQHDLAAIEAELGPEPPEPRLFVEDCTSEALGRRLAGNAERMAVVSSEARKVLQIARGRYIDKAGDLDLWLKGYAGDPHRVDRQGKPPYDLRAPCLSALLLTQPDALQSVGQDPEARASGFLARFLYVCPPSGGALDYPTGSEPADVANAYSDTLAALLDLPPADTDRDGAPLPLRAVLDGEAFALFRELYAGWGAEAQAASEAGNVFLADWLGKLRETAARLALLFAAVEAVTLRHPWPAPLAVTLDHLAPAARLCEHLKHHARAAAGLIGESADVGHARRAWQWIVANLPRLIEARQAEGLGAVAAVKRRDLLRAGLPGCEGTEAAGRVLATQESRGWLQQVYWQRPGAAARPHEIYFIHPEAGRAARGR